MLHIAQREFNFWATVACCKQTNAVVDRASLSVYSRLNIGDEQQQQQQLLYRILLSMPLPWHPFTIHN